MLGPNFSDPACRFNYRVTNLIIQGVHHSVDLLSHLIGLDSWVVRGITRLVKCRNFDRVASASRGSSDANVGRWEASVQLPLSEGEKSRLESLTDLRILDTSPEQVFDDIARLAALICDTPIAVVDFVDEQRVWFKAKIGLELDDLPRDQSFSGHAILQSDVLIVPDPLSDERFTRSFLVREIGIRFYAGVPLIAAKGHAVGTLAAMDRIPHLLTAEQIDSLKILARRISHELELRQTTEVRSTQQRIHLAPSRQPSASILLVEDNDNLRNLLRRTLEGSGFSVISASDGPEALRLCHQHNSAIDLTVSDIVMPLLNGLQMTEEIRAVRPKMKFLFITGFADEFPELRELIKNGADVLEKPFLPSELMGKVEKMLNQENRATGTEG
jgi:CheY-like chemotaxis protein